MSDQHPHTDDSEDSQSRAYNLILEEESSNSKVRGAIQDRAGVDREMAEKWMQNSPSVILKHRPLQDVVELRSLLMRLGASVRIEEVYPTGAETAVLVENDYQVIETTPAVDNQDDVDQPLDEWLPEQKKIPTTKVWSGSLFGSRFWTCLVSVVIIALVLSAITVGMFKCMKSEEDAQERTSSDVLSRLRIGRQPIQLPSLAGISARLDELAHQANVAVENLAGEEESRILDDHDKLQDLKDLTDALDHIRGADSDREKPHQMEPAERGGEDVPTASGEMPGEANTKVSPATIAALQQLDDQRQLENGLTADWEVTGTALSAQTNLPESTQVDVEIRVPEQGTVKHQHNVIQGVINLPAVDYLPIGTIVIQIKLIPLENQPKSVQSSFLGSPEFQPQKWILRAQITLEEERSVSEIPTLDAGLQQISELMENDGLEVSVSVPDIDVDVPSPLVIEGESKDPFLFLKSAVQASGLITQTVNDPAPWVLIRVNQVEYWIESYHCREAVRKYTTSDPELNDYVLNHIYCL